MPSQVIDAIKHADHREQVGDISTRHEKRPVHSDARIGLVRPAAHKAERVASRVREKLRAAGRLLLHVDVQRVVRKSRVEPVAVDRVFVPGRTRIGYLQRAKRPQVNVQLVGMSMRAVGTVVKE